MAGAGESSGGGTSNSRLSVVAVVYALVFLAQVGALAHLASLVTERVDRSAGALALSVLAFASVVGRLVGGVVDWEGCEVRRGVVGVAVLHTK